MLSRRDAEHQISTATTYIRYSYIIYDYKSLRSGNFLLSATVWLSLHYTKRLRELNISIRYWFVQKWIDISNFSRISFLINVDISINYQTHCSNEVNDSFYFISLVYKQHAHAHIHVRPISSYWRLYIWSKMPYWRRMGLYNTIWYVLLMKSESTEN